MTVPYGLRFSLLYTFGLEFLTTVEREVSFSCSQKNKKQKGGGGFDLIS